MYLLLSIDNEIVNKAIEVFTRMGGRLSLQLEAENVPEVDHSDATRAYSSIALPLKLLFVKATDEF